MSFPRDRFDHFLNQWLEHHSTALSKQLQSAIHYSVFSGGKRIRPHLLYLTGQDLNLQEDALFHLGAAVELAHAFSLVHDDLPEMDNDQWRRGKETTHRRFGQGMALMAGDALFNLAFQALIAPMQVQPHQAARMIKEFTWALGTSGMIGGQALEIENPKHPYIHPLKTGALFALSFKLPAVYANQDDTHATMFGMKFGEVFQWADDISDREQDLGSAKNQTDSGQELLQELKAHSETWKKNYPNSKLPEFVDQFINKIV